ncbi:6031_t:CDS:2 [Funneliformis mosseae]|uniref:6031_t:CDS:1 n=1 Tax=Funneliformis mosseae TaxID=27381 RepID=A0A9N9BQI6_FUNMO|nr:6031_t:CDS:2 [Funneliformis mosseae]
MIGMETVRKKSLSIVVVTRKNRKRVCTHCKKSGRRRIGYRMDGIFQIYIGDVEYGVIEVGKKFDKTKLLTNRFKLVKTMHNIFVCLSKEAYFEEMKVRQLQVAGLKLQVLQMSSPKGVLANVWKMKKMIIECMKTVNTRTQDKADFLREIMGTDTPLITIVVPWSIDTK